MKSLLNPAWSATFEGISVVSPWATPSAYTLSIATDQKYSGLRSLKATRITSNSAGQVYTGAGTVAKAITNVYPGQSVRSAVWVRNNRSTGATFALRHRHYSGTTLVSDSTATTVTVPPDQWTRITHSAIVPATVDGIQLSVALGTLNIGEAAWFDDFEVWHQPRYWAATTDQILNLDGVHHRTDSFRFELCDQDLNPIGEVHPDHGSTPSISVDTNNNPTRRLSGLKLIPEEADDVNVLTDRMRVYMKLQNDAEFRLGTFLWADSSRPERSWGDEQHSELIDFSYILDQECTRAFGWGRGTNPMGVIMLFLAFQAGFELADIAPMGRAADSTLTEAVTWQPGSTWRQMIGDLCTSVGFGAPWFDRDGKMHLDQVPDPAKDQPTIPAYGPNTRVVKDSVVFSDGMLSAPNDFAVFDSGTGAMVIGRWQLPTTAPHSRAKRGFPLGMVETVSGLSTQAQADKAVRDLARSKGDAMEELSFTSTLDPRHDMWDVVPAWNRNWLETSHSMELRSGGSHKHNLKRTFYDIV